MSIISECINHSDLASLIAPRAFMVEMGDAGGVIVAPRSLVDREIEKVLEIYRKPRNAPAKATR